MSAVGWVLVGFVAGVAFLCVCLRVEKGLRARPKPEPHVLSSDIWPGHHAMGRETRN